MFIFLSLDPHVLVAGAMRKSVVKIRGRIGIFFVQKHESEWGGLPAYRAERHQPSTRMIANGPPESETLNPERETPNLGLRPSDWLGAQTFCAFLSFF